MRFVVQPLILISLLFQAAWAQTPAEHLPPSFIEEKPEPEQEKQTGPGILGALVPLDIPFDIKLISEFTNIYLNENTVRYEAQFDISNEAVEAQTIKVGLPLIDMGTPALAPRDVSFKLNESVQDFTLEQGKVISLDENLREYIPISQQFETRRVWYTTRVYLGAKEKKALRVSMELDYLYMKDVLNNRREETGKLFRYERSQLSLWQGSTPRSLVYLIPELKQTDRIRLFPNEGQLHENKWTYLVEGRATKPSDDIHLIYDPLDFKVNGYGYRTSPRPRTLDGRPKYDFKYKNILDDDLNTAWCEGEKLGAENFAFEIEWGKYRKIKSIDIFPGVSPDRKEFRKFNRLKKAYLFYSTPGWLSRPVEVNFKDAPQINSVTLPTTQKATILVLQIKEVYIGESADATCISSVKVNLED